MPRYQTRPPKDHRGQSLPLIRTPAAPPIHLIVTSHNLIGLATHYFKGRTTPCTDEACPACNEGYAWRWHGYVSAITSGAHEHVLFEMTAQAAEPLAAYADRYGTLRGCIIAASRLHKRRNGRVILSTKPGDLTKITLPTAPDVCKVLSIIWNLPADAVWISGLNKNHPHAVIKQINDADKTENHDPQLRFA